MVKMIDVIDEFCEFRKYPCERLDGRVSGNERQKSIDRYNKDPNSFVFLLSTRAGGVGINLTAADTVIIFDRYVFFISISTYLWVLLDYGFYRDFY